MAVKLRSGAFLRVAAVAVLVGLGVWYFAPVFGQSGLLAGLGGSALSLAGMVLLEYYRPKNEHEDEGDED